VPLGGRGGNANLKYFAGLSVPFLYTAPCYHQGAFTFLNLSKSFSGGVDWSFAGHGKLWSYNLNYFDFLNQEEMTGEAGLDLIRSFIAGMEENRVGMEPYPISLRGMNWIKFLYRWGIHDAVVDEYLYRQYRHLLRNIEYHLLGNHLLENGFSLLFGACYFGDEKYYRKAEKILRQELKEQILPDGGHFERSPMYHQIILGRILDCINLLSCHAGENRHPEVIEETGFRVALRLHGMTKKVITKKSQMLDDPESISTSKLLFLLEEKAARMLGWLEQMTFRNGEIPLMNDAAFSITPATAVLQVYASCLGVSARLVPLKESGYRKIGNEVYEVILDVGAIGPDYIPGHAHADTLSFELYVGGMPVIVDSGTSTYEDCPLRHYQRSTQAHNTVEIDGQDSSEVWGSFRVARRARVKVLKESKDSIAASHDGYRRLPCKPVHKRECCFSERSVQIRDNISGGFQKAIGRFHFHPDVQLIPSSGDTNSGKIILKNGSQIKWQIEKGHGRLADSTYYPEFNISQTNQCLEVQFDDPETIVEFIF
jgi:hypothetical protein